MIKAIAFFINQERGDRFFLVEEGREAIAF
jgi:hypothetical protein